MSRHGYPQTVAEVLDPTVRFRPATLRAVRRFAKSRPWSGSLQERQEKLRTLHRDLAAAYAVAEPELLFERQDSGSSAGSSYAPAPNRITLVGKPSVVSFLHEWGHALGKSEYQACRWSLNLFRRCFPRQFGRLIQVGHMLIHPRAVRRCSTPDTTNEGPATPTATDK